jgi:hypothetical protein
MSGVTFINALCKEPSGNNNVGVMVGIKFSGSIQNKKTRIPSGFFT